MWQIYCMFRKAPQTSQLNKQKSCTSDVFFSVYSLLSTGLSFNFSASCSQEHWGRHLQQFAASTASVLWVPLFWQLFSHTDKRIISKRINTNGIQNMWRGKSQTSPQTSRDHDREGSVCTSHNSNIWMCYTAAVTTPPFLSVLGCTSH